MDGKKKNRRNERVGPVAANQDNLENNKEAVEGAQGTQDLSKNCTNRESVSPLSRLIKGFRNKYQVSLIPPWEDQCEWYRMTRMAGPDSAVMCNLINTQSEGENGLSKTNQSIRGVCVWVGPCAQSKLSCALHTHRGKKLLQNLQNLDKTKMKKYRVRSRGAREKDAIISVECLGVSQDDTMEGPP